MANIIKTNPNWSNRRTGVDFTNSPISIIKSPPKTIAKREWPLGKLIELGSEPAIRYSGLARPTTSFNSRPAKMGAPLISIISASTRRRLIIKYKITPAIIIMAATQPPRLVTVRARISSQPDWLSWNRCKVPRSPGNVGKTHASKKMAAVTADATARQHHLTERLFAIASYIIHYAS